VLDWLQTFSALLHSWATPEMGQRGLFGSAFLSATILPGSSEVVLTSLITACPEQARPGLGLGLGLAFAGNLPGCLLTFGKGYAGRQG
jgi:membrane protein YqaA with SNARE-associated domain